MTMRSNVRIGVAVAMAAAIVLAIAASAVRSEISGRDAQALSKASLIYVATVRKDGNQMSNLADWNSRTVGASFQDRADSIGDCRHQLLALRVSRLRLLPPCASLLINGDYD